MFKGPTNRIFRHIFHVNSIYTIFTNTHTPAHKDTHTKCASHHISLRLTSHTTLFPLHVVIPRSPVMSRDVQCVPRRAGAHCQYGRVPGSQNIGLSDPGTFPPHTGGDPGTGTSGDVFEIFWDLWNCFHSSTPSHSILASRKKTCLVKPSLHCAARPLKRENVR